VPNKETCCRAGKGDLLHNSGQHWRGRVSTQVIFSHLQGTDMNFSFK
jgi:hypothetical protein